MPITKRNIMAHELIGLDVTVTASSDTTKLGITGTVSDETKNTLSIRGSKSTTIVSKDKSKFSFNLPDGTQAIVQGKDLLLRPEDRTKRGAQRWL